MRSMTIGITLVLILLSLSIFMVYPGSALGKMVSPDVKVGEEGDGFVFINWTMDETASMENLTGFRIYRTVGEGNRTVLDMLGYLERNFNDTTAVNGLIHQYQVSALYTEDLIERFSEPVRARPGTIPGSPENVSLNHQANGILVSWDLPDDDGGFPVDRTIVQRSTMDGPFEIVGTAGLNITDLLDSSADQRTEYSYRLIAINSKGPSSPSGNATILPIIVPPGAPQNTIATVGEDFILIAWGPPLAGTGSPLDGYVVLRSGDDGSDPVETTLGPDLLVFNDTNFVKDVNYTYYVRAFNDGGYSEPSRQITVGIQTLEPDFPEEEIDETSDGKGSTLALIAGIVIGILLIGVALFIYLKLTEDLDDQGEDIDPMNGPPVNP